MNYTDFQTLQANSAAELAAKVQAAIAEGRQPIGKCLVSEAGGSRVFFQTVGTPAEEGGGGDPGGGGGSMVLLWESSSDVLTAYPVDRATGPGAALGSYDFGTAGELVIAAQNPGPGYIATGAASASGGGILAFAAAAGFAAASPGIAPLITNGNATAVAGDANGILFGFSLDITSDLGAYTAFAAQVVGGVLTQVGNSLTGSLGFDTTFATGGAGSIPQPKIMDGHFVVPVTNVSTGRSGGRTLLAFSFDGTDLALEDTLDLTEDNWYATWQGDDYLAFGNSFGTSPDIRFIRYTAAGGFEDAFTVLNADLLANPTDLINNIAFDHITGNIYIGVSDADYLVFSMRVLHPNFGTDALDVVTTIAGLPETEIYPTSCADNLLVMPEDEWGPGLKLVEFDGAGFSGVGSVLPFSPYEAQLVLVPDPV